MSLGPSATLHEANNRFMVWVSALFVEETAERLVCTDEVVTLRALLGSELE